MSYFHTSVDDAKGSLQCAEDNGYLAKKLPDMIEALDLCETNPENQKTRIKLLRRFIKKVDPDFFKNKPMPDTQTEIELIKPGQLSKTLAKSLKQAGKNVTDEMIVKQATVVEQKRVEFVVDCLGLGILLVAKKAATKHGAWMKKETKLAELCQFVADSPRSMRVYRQLANHFLSGVEQGRFDDDFRAIGHRTPSAEDLWLVASERPSEFKNILHKFVGGRSLDRMLKDFRAAEKDAAAEADEDDTGDGNDPEKEPTEEEYEQMTMKFISEVEENIKESWAQFTKTTSQEVLMRMKVEDLEKIRKAYQENADTLKEKIAGMKANRK